MISVRNLQYTSGQLSEKIIKSHHKQSFFGVCIEAFVIAIIQSSSSTTVMLVGLLNTDVMNLEQTIVIIMSASIEFL